MNIEIGTEAAQLPEKKYINGIFVAVHTSYKHQLRINAELINLTCIKRKATWRLQMIRAYRKCCENCVNAI